MATYTSTQNGDWNDPNTWGGGGWPNASGDVVNIWHEVSYNVNDIVTDINKIDIQSGGALIFATDMDTGLNMQATNEAIYIHDGGAFRIGTLASPLSKDYICKIVFANGAAETWRLLNENTSNIICTVCGDPEYYGDQKTATLAATWSAGQTLYVTGDLSSKWQSGQKIYVDAFLGSHSNWALQGDIYEIDTVGTYDSGNDRTPITVVEAGPDIVSNVGAIVVMLSRNIQFLNEDMTWGIYDFAGVASNSYPQIAVCYSLSDEIYARDILFLGIGRVHSAHYKPLTNCVSVNSFYGGSGGQNAHYVDCAFISGQYGQYLTYWGKFEGCIFAAIAYVCRGWYTIFDNCSIYSCAYVSFVAGYCLFKRLTIKDTAYLFRQIQHGKNVIRDSVITGMTYAGSALGYRIAGYQTFGLIENCMINGDYTKYRMITNPCGDVQAIDSSNGNWVAPDSGSDWTLMVDPYAYLYNDGYCLPLSSDIDEPFVYLEAGVHTITFKIYPKNWDTELDQDDIYLQAEYFDDAGDQTSRAYAQTGAGSFANDGWRELSVTFTSALDGIVYLNAFLTRYDSNAFVLIDPYIIIDDNIPSRISVANGIMVFEDVPLEAEVKYGVAYDFTRTGEMVRFFGEAHAHSIADDAPVHALANQALIHAISEDSLATVISENIVHTITEQVLTNEVN
ncbi:MAG: G8 domain-containing protein [Deltaproteobacteria bacterium]|nr:G8 domain-containing protein [Deltaproteobacteria bacterium]